MKTLLLLFLALFLIPLISLPSEAQVAIQDNPGQFTPLPASPGLLPKNKAFWGEVVELEINNQTLPPLTLYRILDVSFTGNHYYRNFIIEKNLQDLRETIQKPISLESLTQCINQINRFNAFQIKAFLQTDLNDSESYHLKLFVYERQPYQITLSVDNQGRPGLGTIRPAITVNDDSFLGLGDQLRLSYINTRRDKRVAADYRLPFNSRGGGVLLHYDYRYADFGPADVTQDQFNPFLSAKQQFWEAGIEQPLDRNRYWTTYGAIAFRHTDNRFGNRIISDPNNRTLTAGLRFGRPDRFGKTSVDVNANFGIKQLDGDFKFSRYRIAASRTVLLPKHNSLLFRELVQMTPDTLPVPSALQIGGAYMVRGYTEGLVTGDRAQFFSAEHHWQLPFLGHHFPTLDQRLQGVTFFDYGRVWQDRSNSRYAATQNNRAGLSTLISTGIGIRAQLSQYAQGFCDLAFGIGDKSHIELNANPAMRVHFGIRSELLPMNFHTSLARPLKIQDADF